MRARIMCILVLALAWSVAAEQPKSAAPAKASAAAKAAAASDAAAAEVLAFETEMEAHTVQGDVAYLDRVLAPDFRFTHGDGWTSGGAPLRVDTRASWIAAVKERPYAARDLDAVKVEMHGDIAITYGRYLSKRNGANQGQSSIWFERVYAKRDGQWQYVSHRTVHGPTPVTPQTANAK